MQALYTESVQQASTWCFVLSSTNQRGLQGFSNAPFLYKIPSKLLQQKKRKIKKFFTF